MRWAWARALLPWLTVGLAVITLPRFSGVTHAQHSPGEADLSFGDHGLVVTDLGGNDVVYAIAIQANGKIVAAGQTERGGNVDIALARYNPDGSLDRTFGRGGIVITDLGGADTAFAVNVERATGRIVVAGVKDSDFALLRYNGDGSLDGSFGSGGVVTVPVVSDDPAVLYALALEADGRIVVAGTAGFVLARFSPDGSLDPTFGDGGLVPTAGGGGVLALAVGALADVAEHQASPRDIGRVEAARGLVKVLHDQLSSAQSPNGLVGSLIDSALVFWQLGPRSHAIALDNPQRGLDLDRLEMALARIAPPRSGAGLLLELGRSLSPATRRAA